MLLDIILNGFFGITLTYAYFLVKNIPDHESKIYPIMSNTKKHLNSKSVGQ
jgi:hypothetical protein